MHQIVCECSVSRPSFTLPLHCFLPATLDFPRRSTMQAARSASTPLRALHGAFLQHLRVQPNFILRAMSVEAHAQGTYLDRSQVVDRVLSVLKSNAKVDPAKVSETASFQQDLGLDSLDEVEIVMAIEEEFALEIPDAEADKIKSTRDVIEFVASHPRAK